MSFVSQCFVVGLVSFLIGGDIGCSVDEEVALNLVGGRVSRSESMDDDLYRGEQNPAFSSSFHKNLGTSVWELSSSVISRKYMPLNRQNTPQNTLHIYTKLGTHDLVNKNKRVSVGFGSKERPRNGIFGVFFSFHFSRRNSLLPNPTETLATQASKQISKQCAECYKSAKKTAQVMLHESARLSKCS